MAGRARAPVADEIALIDGRRVGRRTTARLGEAGDAAGVRVVCGCNADGGGPYDLDDAEAVVGADEVRGPALGVVGGFGDDVCHGGADATEDGQ